MTIGQLLFGWAPRGAEGLNRQQIIAASGRLTDRAQAATQIVLRYCYRPRREAFGWVQDQGVELAFKRGITGVDGSGRPGAFITHALVCRPGTLPRDSLGQLWKAGVWRLEPPSDLIQLPALSNLEELQLGEAPSVNPQIVTAALAHHLANVANGSRSAIPSDDATAVALAAGLAALLPPNVLLPSFSTDESNHALLYDILAGPPPSEHFVPLDTGRSPGNLWDEAAKLLVDAATGDKAAAAAVQAATAPTPTLADAAARLYSCVAIVRAARGDGPVDSRALELAASDPRFARWLTDRAGLGWVGESLVAGSRDAMTFIRAAVDGDPDDRLNDLASSITAAGPTNGTDVLVRLHGVAEQAAQAIVRRVIERWARAGQLDRLKPHEAMSLLRIVASHGGSPGHAGDLLLDMPQMTREVANATDLPVAWRADAVTRHPEALDSIHLAHLIARDLGFAQAIASRESPRIRAAIGGAISAVDPDTARTVVAATAPHVDRRTASTWRWLAVVRLPPFERYTQMRVLVSKARSVSIEQAEMVLDAYIEMILVTRATRIPLPLPPRLRVQKRSARIEEWERFTRQLAHLRNAETARTARAAVHDAVRLGRTADVDVALELVFDSCSGAPTEGIWRESIETVCGLSGENGELCAARVARAGIRSDPWLRSTIGAWVVTWIAHRIDDHWVDPKLLDAKTMEALATDLQGDHMRDELQRRRKDLGRGGGKWMKRIGSR